MQGDSTLLQRAADRLRPILRKRGLAICISGIDGSGKTTLARQLVDGLDAAGLPSRYLHLYQWYVNLFATPVLLLYNRHVGRKVLLFDRSIFDNIAVAAASRRCPRWLTYGALASARALYPRFDHRFYLVTDFSETLRRRPDTREQRFAELTLIYEWIAATAGHVQLHSGPTLFGEVLALIAARSG